MPTARRSSGITVNAPSTYLIGLEGPPDTTRRRGEAPSVEATPLEEELIVALGALELSHVDTVPLTPTQTPSDPVRRRSTTAAKIPATQEIGFEATLQPGEQAVALMEQDGVFTWSFGEILPASPTEPRRRGDTAASHQRTIRFTIDVHASSSRMRRTRGLADVVFRPVKALFFKFAANVVIGRVVKRLEANLERGLVHVNGTDPRTWARIEEPSTLGMPASRPPRILLLIHGTFSSTRGGFGSLGASEWGLDLLTEALQGYDLVLGYDHPTLSEDPMDNAEEILAALRALDTQATPLIDVVTHSRGGLVYRSLVEHLLPNSDWQAAFGNAVFVAATNGGTELANTENWSRFIDLYTNLAVAGMKGLSLLAPPTGLVTSVLSGVLKGIAVIVKAMAVATLDEGQVPGLAAMSPKGDFVRQLNETQPGQPVAGNIDNYIVMSNFEADLAAENTIPAKLKAMLTDGLVDQLLGQDNDLVVNTAAMTMIDPHVAGFVTDILDFAANGKVHHTNYFHHQATAAALHRWLTLGVASERMVGGVPHLPSGATAAESLPFPVEQDFVLISSTMAADDAARLIADVDHEYAVVRRVDPGGETYHYAVRTDELEGALTSGRTVHESLDLHEYTASPPISLDDVAGFEEPTPDFWLRPSAGRRIVVSDDQLIGIIPSEEEMMMAESPKEAAPVPPRPRRRTARRRGSRPVAANGGGRLPEPEKARHFFRAQMPREVVLKKPATVEVTVAREELEMVAGRTGGVAGAAVDMERKLIVQVIPRKNFDLIDSSDTPGRTELEPIPAGGDPISLFFDVKAVHASEGQIDVVVRQGQVPLATIELKPKIVKKRSPGPVTLAVAERAVADAPISDGPLHQLSIHEEQQGTKVRLRFEFDSKPLGVLLDKTSDWLEEGSISDYVASRYHEIEGHWAQDQGDTDAFTVHLQAIGIKLFKDLVPQPIREALWKHRKDLDSIQVLSTEPHIPWEIVHLAKPDGSAPNEEWFFGQMGLVRWMWNLPVGYPQKEIRIDKALAIVPDYPPGSGYELPTTAQEFAFVQKLFNAARIDPPEFTSIISTLKDPTAFDLLHFAGHGVSDPSEPSDAKLLLKVINQNGQWEERSLAAVDVESFADLSDDGQAPVVVLNACQVGRLGHDLSGIGGFAKAFLSKGAGVFVSSLWSVGDEPAKEFIETFYNKLVKGVAMKRAVTEARAAARQAGDATWLAYTVYANPNATMHI